MKYCAQRGFTLVELAIVLVIIGLIVGGVLVGQDMIKAAEVRATVGQYEKYNAAVNTFRTKYNGLPGDLNSASAARFGMVARSGAVGHGDGNGLLEGCSAGSVNGGCETMVFWRDLGFANLIDSTYNGGDNFANPVGPAPITTAEVPSYLPKTKIGRGIFFVVYSESGINYYEIAGIMGIEETAGIHDMTLSLTPIEAFNIDNKVDDGIPTSGTVRALEQGIGSLASDGTCRVGEVYDTGSPDSANTPDCALRLRFN